MFIASCVLLFCCKCIILTILTDNGSVRAIIMQISAHALATLAVLYACAEVLHITRASAPSFRKENVV